MKYFENGFFLEQNLNKTRKEISDEQWQELLKGQSEGLEIYTDESGFPKLREHSVTDEEIKLLRMHEIQIELNSLNQDLVQDLAGEMVPNIEERKQRFIELHNEMRNLLGKSNREVING